jgi:hypothetical protein
MTIPKAELKVAVVKATTAAMVRRNLGDMYGSVTYCINSSICLHWITQDDCLLQNGVRNAVVEIRRFSDTNDWFHITYKKNVTDLRPKLTLVAEIGPGLPCQIGQLGMTLTCYKMPLMLLRLHSQKKRSSL